MTPLALSWASEYYNRISWLLPPPLILWRRLLSGVALGPLLLASPLSTYSGDAPLVPHQGLLFPPPLASVQAHLGLWNRARIWHPFVVMTSLTYWGWKMLAPVLHLPQPTVGQWLTSLAGWLAAHCQSGAVGGTGVSPSSQASKLIWPPQRPPWKLGGPTSPPHSSGTPAVNTPSLWACWRAQAVVVWQTLACLMALVACFMASAAWVSFRQATSSAFQSICLWQRSPVALFVSNHSRAVFILSCRGRSLSDSAVGTTQGEHAHACHLQCLWHGRLEQWVSNMSEAADITLGGQPWRHLSERCHWGRDG